MKRYLFAGALALTFGAGTFAFANSLAVSSDTLASGTDTVDKGCESVAISYTTTYTVNGYELDDITLDGGTGCTTQSVTVDVAGAGGTSLAQFTDVLATGDVTIDASSADIDAALVTNVSAVFTN